MRKEYPSVEVGQIYVDRDHRKPNRYLRVERIYNGVGSATCVRVTRNAMSDGLFVEASPRRLSSILLSRLQSRDYALVLDVRQPSTPLIPEGEGASA